MRDYREYVLSVKERLWNAGLFLVIDAMISYLFYRSFVVFLLLLPAVLPFFKMRKQTYCKRRQMVFLGQFLEGMQAVETALRAGYSIETAFAQALGELQNRYPKEAMVIQEFRYISVQMNMNRSLEGLLTGLAKRSGLEDIRNFADVFAAAKRTGGNLVEIIRNTILCASQKEDTRKEIATCLAAKKLEQNIMSVIPCVILFYVQIVSPGFLDGMYHNAAGVMIMTLCLGIYVFAWFWGRKIVTIEV